MTGFLTAVLMVVSAAVAPAAMAPQHTHRLQPQIDSATPAAAVASVPPPTASTGVPYQPPAPVWPQPSTVETSQSSSAMAKVAGTPVWLGGVSSARVQVFDRVQTQASGVDGVLMRVSKFAGVAKVSVEYSGFESAFGADWASRLRLVALPECALSTPELAACRGAALSSAHEYAHRRVSADVTADSLLALTAGTSSASGDYAATSLQPSSTWAAGGGTGGFSWTYPMRTPPALGGPAPAIRLAYSSQSVDGRMAASNNQPSWVGEGFEWSPGFIERRYRPCAKDMAGGNNASKTGDLCWATDNATLSLNGSGGELLKAGQEWRSRIDNGSRIQRKTGGPNGANNGEYWVVTVPDGTQYWFGGRAGSNATWTVPVFGNHAGEPCHQPSFTASACAQAWRWNLDYVVDPRGNTMAYTYVRETNRYGQNNTPTNAVAYDRAGYLASIEYGTRAGVAATAPMRVLVTTGDRCLSSCTVHDAAHWPDTPYDLECAGSPCYVSGPSFWTTRRLAKLTTQLWTGSGTSYSDVESWTLAHSFPNPGDGTRAGLWLDRISHTGHIGGNTSVPDVLFTGVQMPNRVDAAGADWATAMNWWRMRSITTETGGTISVTYAPGQCVAGSVMPAAPHDNRLRCYPVRWIPDGYQSAVTDWMHKYVVTQVSEADLALPANERSAAGVTRYQYLGDPAWHYTDDDGLIDADDKTWSVWRGYGAVRTLKGDPGPQEVITETRYYRGMHGDKQPTGARSVTLPAVGSAPAVADEDAYSGMVRESLSFKGSAEVSGQVNEAWQSVPTAGRTINGVTVHARHTGVAATWTRTARDNGRPARTTSTRTTFDAYGVAVKVDIAGDDSVTGDERCTLTTLEPRNVNAWLTSYPHRTQTFATDCVAAQNGPLTADDIIRDSRTFYDQATAHGTAPVKGLVSRTEELKTWTAGSGGSGTQEYVLSSTASHDSHGRILSSTDIRGNTTTTVYTHGPGGQLASTTVTNNLNWTTRTTFQPAWGSAMSTVDPNGRRTDLTHDGLGRVTAVWLPGRDKQAGATASLAFAYAVRNNAATVVSTSKLLPSGDFQTTHAFFDSLLRPRQTQGPWADTTTTGRVITDTLYDTAGRAWLSYGPHAALGAASTNLYPRAAEATMPAVTRTLYDPANRPTASIFLSLGTEKWRTTTAYGGDRTDITPPAGGIATSTIVDIEGRTVRLRHYHGGSPTPWTAGSYDETGYTFNRKGQLEKVTDPAGNRWTYAFDLRGRPMRIDDPDRGATLSTFNDAGDLLSTTDSRGEVLAYTYDSLGRKTSLRDDTATGPKRAEWIYDTVAKGKPAKNIRYSGTAAYVSEILGYTADYRPTATAITIPATETGLAGTYTYSHTYWADGSPSTTTLPDVDGAGGLGPETLSYRYNAVGLPDQLLTSNDGTYVLGTTYTRYGEPTLTGFATDSTDLVEQSRRYEEGTRRLSRVITSRVVSPSGVADVNYRYDAAGNVTKVSDLTSADHQCFTYARMRRLAEAWTPGNGDCATPPSLAGLGGPAKYWSTWTFDAIGNRLAQMAFNPNTGARDLTTSTYPAAGAPQPHALQSTNAGPYAYDSAGNTKARPTPTSGTQSLIWDAEGRLESSADGTGTTAFLYDADGNRLIRRDPVGRTLYLPQQELRYVTSTAVKSTSRYYTHNGAAIAVRTQTALTWLVSDHQNTTSRAVNAGTQAVATRRQTPYGALRAATGSWPSNMDRGFVGGTNDNTGLTHLGAREYDPAVGRFISVDPVFVLDDPQQHNAYQYAANNPLTYSDPTGMLLPDASGGGGTGGSSASGSEANVCHGGNQSASCREDEEWDANPAFCFGGNQSASCREAPADFDCDRVPVSHPCHDNDPAPTTIDLKPHKPHHKPTVFQRIMIESTVFALQVVAQSACIGLLGSMTGGVGAVVGGAICGGIAGGIGEGVKYLLYTVVTGESFDPEAFVKHIVKGVLVGMAVGAAFGGMQVLLDHLLGKVVPLIDPKYVYYLEIPLRIPKVKPHEPVGLESGELAAHTGIHLPGAFSGH